jgi:hypothetical protein
MITPLDNLAIQSTPGNLSRSVSVFALKAPPLDGTTYQSSEQKPHGVDTLDPTRSEIAPAWLLFVAELVPSECFSESFSADDAETLQRIESVASVTRHG